MPGKDSTCPAYGRNRIVLGDKVIDHERISGIRDAPIEIAVMYQVVEELIERVWVFAQE